MVPVKRKAVAGELFASAVGNFQPQPRVRSLLWMCENAQTDLGRPYDHSAYPHIGAPGGPCDAIDDPAVRTIVLQWGSRLGKTTSCQWMQQFFADVKPDTMMFATSEEILGTDVIARMYLMLEHNRRLADQLLLVRLRNKHQIKLQRCRIYVAWSRSISRLADKRIRYGHANEVDKWKHPKKPTEADPLKLFTDRFKDNPTHKKAIEGTPTLKGRSRVERARLGSTNCRFEVPCPHCRRYQVLRFGDGKSPGGIQWQKLPNGKHDKDLARSTAHYVCQHCGESIQDHHRAGMMRRGVWCPEGATVDDAHALRVTEFVDAGGDGASQQDYLTERYQWRGWRHASWIRGTPVRDGYDAGYQLSSLYALSLGWGDIAAEFVATKDNPGDFQNFINQWLAQTWELRSRQQTWEQLGSRLVEPNLPHAIVPAWGAMVTIGVDRQEESYVYVVDAWGPSRQSATIDYGQVDSLDELFVTAIDRVYKHADGKGDLRPAMALIDSGYKPEGVYEFCKRCLAAHLPVWPSKGSSNSLNADYRVSTLNKDTSMPGMRLTWVDTARTQGWLERQLHDLERNEPGGASLFQGSLGQHQDFLEQLLNDSAVAQLDASNNSREVWQRISTSIPNDYRDCRRYGYVAMLIVTRGAPLRDRAATLAAASAREQSNRPQFTTPDGRPFLISERQ